MSTTIQTALGVGTPSTIGRTSINQINVQEDTNRPQLAQSTEYVDYLRHSFPNIITSTSPNLMYQLTRGSVEDEGSVLNRLSANVIAQTMAQHFEEGGRYTGPQGQENLLNDTRKVGETIRRNVIASTYTGEDISTSIINRRKELLYGTSYDPSQQSLRNDFRLGQVTGISESNGDPGRISSGKSDRGGISYGLYQFASAIGSLQRFMESNEFSSFKNNFEGLEVNSEEFKAAWQRVALENSDSFSQAQHDYIVRTHYQPNVSRFSGLDLENPGIQEFVFSSGVQHSPEGNVAIFNSFKEANPNWENMPVEEQIRGLYTARLDYALKHTSEDNHAGIVSRMNRERDQLIQIAGPARRVTENITTRPEYPIGNFVGIINRNPELFPELVDDNKFKFRNNDLGIAEFRNELDSNPELVTRLLEQDYQDFLNELGKRHNNVFDSPDHKVRAYSIFSRFGGEGLTQYSNFYESFDPNVETQSQKHLQARLFLQTADVGGVTPIQYAEKFAENFRVQPIQPSLETLYEFPADLTEFTVGSYVLNKQTSRFERLPDRKILQGLIQKHLPELNVDDVVEGSDEYMRLVFKIANNVSPDDLMDTIRAHSTPEEIGNENFISNAFRIQNWREKPIDVRLAIDALRANVGTQGLVRSDFETRGKDVIFEPERATRVQRLGFNLGTFGLDNKFMGYEHALFVHDYDEEGNRVLSKGMIPGVWNTAMAFGLGLADFAFYEIGSWIANATVKTAEMVESQNADTLRSLYENTFGERKMYNRFDQQGFTDNPLATSADIASMFVGFYRSLLFAGKTAFQSLYHANRVIAPYRNYAMLGSAAGVMKTGKDMGKYELLLSRLATDPNNRRLLAGQLAMGDAIVSAVLPTDLSFYGSGLVDMLGTEGTREWYLRSNLMTQVGVDVVTNVGLGVLLDGIIASARSVRPSSRAGQNFFDSTWQKSDTGNFFRHIGEQLDSLPVKTTTDNVEAYINSLKINRDNISSIDDVAQLLRADGGEVMATLRSDIEATLRHYDAKFTGTVRENLAEQAEGIYRRAIDDFANKINTLSETPTGLAARLATALENTIPVVRTVDHPKGNEPLTLAEANALFAQAPHRKIVTVDGGFKVEELVPEQWVTDLADALRRTDANYKPETFSEQVLEAYRSRKGSVTTSEEIEVEALNQVVGGAAVRVNDQDAVVLGWTGDNNYLVRTVSGEVIDAPVDNSFILGHLSGKLDANQITSVEVEQLLDKLGLQLADIANAPIPQKTAQDILDAAWTRMQKEFDDAVLKQQEKQTKAKAKHQKDTVAKNKKGEKFDPEKKPKVSEEGVEQTTPAPADGQLPVTKKELLDADTKQWGFVGRITNAFNIPSEGLTFKQKLFRIVTKLGVNDERVLKTKDPNSKSRIVGINQKAPSEYKVTNRDIPQGTVVSVVNEDGTINYFMANTAVKATDVNYPTRFVESDSGATLNPNWSQVNQNQTIGPDGLPQLYVRDTDGGVTGSYRPALEGEKGVFLNVQNAYDIDLNTKGTIISQRDAAEQGYDAFVFNDNGVKHYTIFDHVNQAVEPRHLLDEVIRTGYNPADMASMGAWALAFGAAGAGLGTMADEEFMSAGGGLGGIVGAILGRRKLRPNPRFSSVSNKKVPKGNFPDESTAAQGSLRDNADLAAEHRMYGLNTNTNNPIEVAENSAIIASMNKAISAGTPIFEWFKTSRFTQAGRQLMDKYGGPSAKKLGKALYDIDTAQNLRLNKFYTALDAKLGEGAHRWIGGFDEETPFITKAKEFFTSQGIELNNQQAYEQWNESVTRIRTASAKMQNGTFTFDPNAQSVLDAWNRNPKLKQFDEFFINQKEFQDLNSAINESFFFPAKGEHFETIQKHINNELADIKRIADATENPRIAELANEWAGTRLSYGKFIKELSPEDAKLFKRAKKGTKGVSFPFKRLSKLQSDKSKFVDQGDSYLPMTRDAAKLKKVYNRHVSEYLKQNPTANNKDASNYANQMMMDEFARVNQGRFDGVKNKVYDPETGEISEQIFSSKKRAKEELTAILKDFDNELKNYSLDNTDSFIKQLPDKVNRRGKAVKQFVITVPENAPEPVKQALKEFQDKQLEQFFSNLWAGNIIRNSNHLTQPVKFELPLEWRVNNIDEQIKRYARDVTPMLEMRKIGILEESDIERLFLAGPNGIRTNLEKSGFSADKIEYLVSRIKNNYGMQNNIITHLRNANSPEEQNQMLQQYINSQRMSATVRNVLQGQNAYFIAMLDTFQAFIYSPILSSGRAVREVSGAMLRDSDYLKKMEQFASVNGLVARKLETFKPQFRLDGVDDFTGTDWSTGLGQAAYIGSSKLADFSANMSFTKYAMKGVNRLTGGLIKADINDLGIFRLGFDDFYGVNSVSTTINMTAALNEAAHISRIWKKFQLPENANVSTIENLSRQDIIDKFANFGITDIDNPVDRINRFVRNQDDIDNFLAREGDLDLDLQTRNPEAWDDLATIAQYSTDAYHGKNRMNRPETWSSPVGKVLSQYSVYSFNLSMQTFNRRIADPIRTFNSRIENGDFGDTRTYDGNWYNVIYHARRNNTDKLHSMGLTDEMIQAIPAQQFDAMYRTLWLAVGTNAVLFGRHALQDAVEATVLDNDEWRRTRRNLTVNPFAPPAQQKTLGDIINGTGMTIDDFYNLTRYGANFWIDSSIFGRYDIFLNPEGWARGGVLNIMGPGVGMVDDMSKRFGTALSTPPSEVPSTIPRLALEQTLRLTPGSTYTGAAMRRINEIPENETAELPPWFY